MTRQKEVDPLTRAFLNAFPNPQRQGCPEKSVLQAIAHHQFPLNDPAQIHVSSCSPCFEEVLEYQAKWKKKRRILVLLACATFVLMAAVAGWFWKSKY